jgi:hypothetical protein
MSRRIASRERSIQAIRTFLQTMITLASALLGLVAALAWNDAIKATFKHFLKENDSLPALCFTPMRRLRPCWQFLWLQL